MGIRELKFICTSEEEYIYCRTKRLKFGVGGLIYEIAYIPELYLNALITTMNRVSTKIDNLPPLSPADSCFASNCNLYRNQIEAIYNRISLTKEEFEFIDKKCITFLLFKYPIEKSLAELCDDTNSSYDIKFHNLQLLSMNLFECKDNIINPDDEHIAAYADTIKAYACDVIDCCKEILLLKKLAGSVISSNSTLSDMMHSFKWLETAMLDASNSKNSSSIRHMVIEELQSMEKNQCRFKVCANCGRIFVSKHNEIAHDCNEPNCKEPIECLNDDSYCSVFYGIDAVLNEIIHDESLNPYASLPDCCDYDEAVNEIISDEEPFLFTYSEFPSFSKAQYAILLKEYYTKKKKNLYNWKLSQPKQYPEIFNSDYGKTIRDEMEACYKRFCYAVEDACIKYESGELSYRSALTEVPIPPPAERSPTLQKVKDDSKFRGLIQNRSQGS